MKKHFFLLLLFVATLWSAMAQTPTNTLELTNLSVMFQEGRPMPDGTKEGNRVVVTVTLQNPLLANRIKVVVKQKSTEEILEVKTIAITEKDGISFYTSNGYPQPMKSNYILEDLSIGALTPADVVVEVFGVDTKGVMTKRLQQ